MKRLDNVESIIRISEKYCKGNDTDIYVELNDGRIVEIMGIKPTANGTGLILTLSSKPYDYKQELME